MLRIFDTFFLQIGLERDELCSIDWKTRAALYTGMALASLVSFTFITLIILDELQHVL